MNRDTVEIFNAKINNVDFDEAIEIIDFMINDNDGRFKYIFTPNVDHLVRIAKDEYFKKMYDNADLILVDGQPIVFFSRLIGKGLKKKVSGSDLFIRLCEYSSLKHYKVFFLGAAEGVAERAAENLRAKYKDLDVVGIYSPSYGFEKNEEENKKIIRLINEKKPDILFVGVGTPKQEKWIYENKDLYKVPVSIGIGASFDFTSGKVKRAPKWMQDMGFEWLYRLAKEPKRLFKRVFIDDSYFFILCVKEIVSTIKGKGF